MSATGLMFVPLNVDLKYSFCAFPIIHIVSISRQLDHSCIKDRDGEITVMQEEKKELLSLKSGLSLLPTEKQEF